MKKIVFIFMLALGLAWDCHAQSSSSSSWTYLQDSPIIFCGQGGSKQTCTISTSEIAPTTAGSVWVIQVMTPNNVTISSVTGGGGTWVRCPNCHIMNTYSIDAWYNLGGNAGTTQGITINLSGQSGTFFNINFVEFLPPPGSTASFDDSGAAAPTNCSACVGPTLSHITGTDVIWENPGGASKAFFNSATSPYVTDVNGGAFALNTTSGAGPTVTFDAAVNPSLMAIAFTSTKGTFTPPVSQYSIVQFAHTDFKGNNNPNCNPFCTVNLTQATAAGHLLFIMAADLHNDHITALSGGGSWVIPTGANTCQISYNDNQGGNDAFSCGYILSTTAGTTSINVTLSGSSTTGFGVWEIASTNGAFAFDTQGSHLVAGAAAQPGQSLTLNNANDVIFQGGFVPGGASATTAYPDTYIAHNSGYILFNEASEALLLDSGPTPVTPTWINPQVNQISVFGIAFSASGTAVIPAPPTNLKAVVN